MSRRKQLATASIKRQKGVAGIWLGFTLVPIMGFTFWAVEGTRYVQEYNRLGDANEAAAMAMTIQDNPDNAEQLAKDYLQSYVRDIDSMSIVYERTTEEDSDQDEFVQYSLTTSTSHKSWFTSTFIPSFDEQVNLGGKAVAKKYSTYLGDNNIDIVFVADFSGSMGSKWNDSASSSNRKIDDLQYAINEVSKKILCSRVEEKYVDDVKTKVCVDADQADMANKLDNRIALAPFNTRTREVTPSGEAYAVSQLHYRSDYKPEISVYDYSDVSWNDWRKASSLVVDFCALFCQGAQREQAKRISDVLNGERYPDTHNYIDYELTVSDMLSDKYIDQSSKYLVNDVNLYTGYGLSENEQFKNIPLTNSLSEIDQINQMKASGDTAAYQGILKGTQLLAAGNPNSPSEDEQEAYQSKVKMLLIFSDGVEVPDPTILQTLVDTGMCDRARSLIPGLYIGFIGIDFDADKIMAFENCVNNKETDIIKVTNLDDLIAKIEELIKNGSKSNGFTKLY